MLRPRWALVYQPYNYTAVHYGLFGEPVKKKKSGASWLLWLSDAPFADHDPKWTPPAAASGE